MKRIAMLTALVLTPLALMFGQLTRGYLSGAVQDPSGALAPGVKVVVKELATKVERWTETNEAGVYRLAAIEPGVYSIEFSKPGFESRQIEPVEVGVAQEIVVNHSLTIASTGSSVNVTAAPPGIELSKATPTVDRRLGRDVLENLPLSGIRMVTGLIGLAPGIARDRIGGQGSDAINSFAAGGQAAAANGLQWDGADTKDPRIGGNHFEPIPEGVAEVHIQTNTYSAEFGGGGGAQVSVVSKSGTNQFHGALWDYFDADWMRARTLGEKRARFPKTRHIAHQSGASLGGPVIPNRTFFFGMVQARPIREGSSPGSRLVLPTPEGYAALARAPLGPDQTTESRRTMLDALSFLPDVYSDNLRFQPANPFVVNGVSIPAGTTSVPIRLPADWWNLQARLDHHWSDNDALAYNYRARRLDAPISVAFSVWSNNAFGPRFASAENARYTEHSLSYTHIFGPRLLNEARVVYGHFFNDIESALTGPSIVVSNAFTFGPWDGSPRTRDGATLEGQDIATCTTGRHSIKAGFDVRRVRDAFTYDRYRRGLWTFNNLQDFLNNRATQLRHRPTLQAIAPTQIRQNYFVQDDFKVSKGLTVNLGVRYQYAPIPSGGFGATDPAVRGAGVRGLVRADRNDVAPRLGIAWSLGAGMVLRGGYGVSYEQSLGAAIGESGPIANYPNTIDFIAEFPATLNLFPSLAGTPTSYDAKLNFINFLENTQNPTTHFYSFSVQRQFREHYMVELGYLGNRSYHLLRRGESNPAILTPQQAQLAIAGQTIPTAAQRRVNPAWGSRATFEAAAGSVYNAGFVRFDRRLARGLLIGANYTWSANLGDYGGGSGGIGVPFAQSPQDFSNARAEYSRTRNDVPHRLALHYVWQSPSMRGWRQILSGWQIAGFSEWQSGQPFTVTTGVDSNGNGAFGANEQDRPAYNPAGRLTLDPVTGDWRSFTAPLNGGVFVTPLARNGSPLANSVAGGGNLGRNTFRGPGYAQWNVGLSKRFSISERWKLDLRADTSNLFNHRNFGNPVASMNAPNFGTNQSDPPSRSILLSLKLRF